MLIFLKHILFQIIFIILFSAFAFAEFVIGLYGVKTSTDVIKAKEAGFNCVQTYVKNPDVIDLLAGEAKNNEIKLIAYPDKVFSSKYREIASKYPIKAWYLFDEPDVWNLSREEVIALNKKAKTIYPKNETAFVIGEGLTEMSYYDIGDILMVDWYPVPHLPLESFGENVALAKRCLKMIGQSSKELWGVVQIFNWKEYKQFRPDEDRIGRFPKKEEIRFMSYDAIFNGANGVFYFTCYSENEPLYETKKEKWKDVVDVIQEMSFIAEIIDNGKEIENPIEIEEPLKAKSFEYGGIKYTVIINPTSKKQTLPIFFFQSQFDVIYEKSTNLKKIIRKTKNNFLPYKVFVLRYE